jgi:histidine phosphotransferase ChpT
MPDKPDTAALIGSRICHDLISPIGAISNGVELLVMDGATMGAEMTLVAESVAHAKARIRFFRVAFGQTAKDQRIGVTEVRSILGDMARGTRLTVDWTSPAELSRRETKLAFLLILCLETAMGTGGQIQVFRDDSRWHLTATSPKLRVDPKLWETLSNPAAGAEIGPALVQFLLAPEEVARQHRRLTVELNEAEIRLSF